MFMVLMGVLPYIVVVDQVSLLPQNHEKRYAIVIKNSMKTAPANKRMWRTEPIATIYYRCSSSKLEELQLLLRVSTNHSILQPWHLFCSVVCPVKCFLGRMQSWRAIFSFYCPLVAIKRIKNCLSVLSCCLGALNDHNIPVRSLIEW